MAAGPKLAWRGSQPPFGPDRPCLVLIHGAGMTSRFFSAQLDGLSEEVHLVAVDLPGHGDSAGPPAETIPAAAEAVSGLLDSLQVDRPVIGGMSMGGGVALQLLADYPERFSAAVLLSTGAKLRVRPDIFAAIEADFERYVELVGQMAVAPGTDPAAYAQVLEDLRAGGPAVAATDFRACDPFDLREQVPGIRVPALVACGDQDLLTPPKYSDWLAENLPNATRVTIPGAGHFACLERPAEVNRVLAGFLATLPA